MNSTWLKRGSLLLAASVTMAALTAAPASAGPDDDARFRPDGTTRNNIDPVFNPVAPFGQGGNLFSDNPTQADPVTGLRIMPPTETQLLVGQRFDLRVETQIPATAAPTLVNLTVNGTNVTSSFLGKVAAQDTSDPTLLESGRKGLSALFYGNTVRNLSFNAPGSYVVSATVSVNGTNYTIVNTYRVAPFALNGNVKKVVFFLGDAVGLPVRTAARVYGRSVNNNGRNFSVFEGRSGKLNMDKMDDYGMVKTASLDSLITDSAPGMANYITGLKQPNNGLNVSPDNTPADEAGGANAEAQRDNPRIETLWEFLKRTQGWKIGVVTDSFLTDATPAAAFAHTRTRGGRLAIASQMLDFYQDGTAQPLTGFASLRELTQQPDVLLGAGARDFLKTNNTQLNTFFQYTVGTANGRATTDVDLFADIAPALGYSTVKTLAELNAAPNNQPLFGLFVGEFRPNNALGVDNIPGALDRLVANGAVTISGVGASDPRLEMNVAPPLGTGCGATVQACYQGIPSKTQMVSKAVNVLNTLAGSTGGWALLVEQSQTDKLAHPLEYERTVYDALELDNAIGFILNGPATDGKTLTLMTADHAQPESIIGVVLPAAVGPSGATPVGGCFTASTGNTYPITLGSSAITTRPCALQDAVGTFNDGTFPTYQDLNGDGFPDEVDPEVKIVIEDAGRPTYTQNYLTNFKPLNPSGASAALPNPARDSDGILLTGNMPTRNTRIVAGSTDTAIGFSGANKTNGNTGVAPHSGDDVPISASGPGSNLFGGVYENTDVHVRLGAALSGVTSKSVLNQGTPCPDGTPCTYVPTAQPAGTSLTGF